MAERRGSAAPGTRVAAGELAVDRIVADLAIPPGDG